MTYVKSNCCDDEGQSVSVLESYITRNPVIIVVFRAVEGHKDIQVSLECQGHQVNRWVKCHSSVWAASSSSVVVFFVRSSLQVQVQCQVITWASKRPLNIWMVMALVSLRLVSRCYGFRGCLAFACRRQGNERQGRETFLIKEAVLWVIQCTFTSVASSFSEKWSILLQETVSQVHAYKYLPSDIYRCFSWNVFPSLVQH